MDRCDVPRCRAEASIGYLGRGVCENHWNKLTADDAPHDALRMSLGLPAVPDAAMEDAMDATSKTSKAEAAEAAPVKSKSAKQPKAKKEKAPKPPKPVREQVEKPVVFAFRLSEADRTRIHEAAGPAGATRFVRSAALAAATGDTKAFEALTAQAKANKK